MLTACQPSNLASSSQVSLLLKGEEKPYFKQRSYLLYVDPSCSLFPLKAVNLGLLSLQVLSSQASTLSKVLHMS